MTSVEQTYQLIAETLISRLSSNWAQVVFETKILKNSCSSMSTTEFKEDKQSYAVLLGMEAGFTISDACIFLRNELLKKTGNRIWGLTFTLFSDGKFHMDYDYSKPADYEEGDETIEVDLNKDIPGQS